MVGMPTLRVQSLAFACVFAQVPAVAWAQDYPTRSIRYIIGASAGSSADVIARLVGGGLTQRLGQTVVVDPRPGAGANIGPELAAKATPDGHTLYQTTISQALNVTLYRNLPYDLLRDFVPITQMVTEPTVIVVHPSVAATTIGELINLAKAKPGALNYSSAGTGTFTFLAGELFKARAGINLTHVPYKGGGPALTAVISNEVPVYFAPVSVGMPHARQGRLRALAVTALARLAIAQEVPTASESGLAGFQFGNWYGLVAPAKTPRKIVATLHGATVASLNDPAIHQRFTDLGYIVVGNTSEAFGAFMRSQVETLAKVVRDFNLKSD